MRRLRPRFPRYRISKSSFIPNVIPSGGFPVRFFQGPSTLVNRTGRRSFSSLDADQQKWQDSNNQSTKHCETCTCESTPQIPPVDSSHPFACGSPAHEDDFGLLPPPLKEPAYSVHKRVLPASLTSLSSSDGRRKLLEALTANTAESYWALSEQFVSQTDPAFCGVTTLVMCLNAFNIDPDVRWRGGWRWYGSEDVVLDRCCLSSERIRRVGVTLEEFRLLGRCHGLSIDLKRPQDHGEKIHTLESFREDIVGILSGKDKDAILVVAFSRSQLGQTGDGHFSPLAAYHEPTDSVLLLDVARFKYSPYWVSIESLYASMEDCDSTTGRTRGWFVLRPPLNHSCSTSTNENRRPADLVKQVGEGDACPVAKIKVDFCEGNLHDG